ncbi:MAG TPA: glucosaminidase domain-containing protein [Bacteroidales bacterium]|nr:glucosaminidase domain-containing protein [Bacteroidales bacterium]
MQYVKLFSIVILSALISCSGNDKKATYQAYTEDELRFISKFDHQLLNQMARKTLSLEHEPVESPEDIKPIENKKVRPVVYNQLLSTKYMEQDHQKEVFIAQMLPQILITKYYMDQQKQVLEMLLADDTLNKGEAFDRKQEFIEQQLEKYDADNTGKLINMLTTHPTSLILAQAAVESNWGSTRSYAEANNPFHAISKDDSEPRLETFAKDSATIFLKKYQDLPAAITDYFRNINRAEQLADFRKHRQNTSNPFDLIQHLDAYTQKYGQKYTRLLENLIRRNSLTRYDQYSIDSSYVNILTREEIAAIIEEQTDQDKNIVSTDAQGIQNIQSKNVDVQYKSVGSPEDIVNVESRYVVPNVYTNVVDLKYLPLQERKEKFLDLLLPSVLTAAHGIEQTRERIAALHEQMQQQEPVSKEDSLFVQKQLKAWEAEDIEQLLNEKLLTRPNSVMLAQAALETGWGSSRFFVAANNTFGVWSFNPKESRIQAKGTREGTPVYVKKYDNLSASIIDYYKVISNGPYDEYREARKRTSDPYVLVEYLFRYSELGQEYINRLKTVMRKADMEKYDDYRLDPTYIQIN